jgi:hypothetical protein
VCVCVSVSACHSPHHGFELSVVPSPVVPLALFFEQNHFPSPPPGGTRASLLVDLVRILHDLPRLFCDPWSAGIAS